MIIGQAAIADGKGGFSVENIHVMRPIKDNVVVEIKASGVCHTDWDSLSWGKPIILGHEGAGIVSSVGEAVTKVKVGDKVLLNWAVPCYTCPQCQRGNQHICEVNSPVTSGNKLSGGHAELSSTTYNNSPIERSFGLGTLATHAVVREAALVKIDVEIPMSSASILGCGVMTGYGSVVNAAKVTPGSSVVVIGAGGVGLNVIQGAKIAGASRIIAVDINENKLELSKKFGATDLFFADKNDDGLSRAANEIRQLLGGRGADFAFECTAVPMLGAAPLAMIRNAGTACQVSGIEQTIPIDMNLFEWDKIYINPLYGQCRPDIDFPIMLNLYKKGDLLLDELVTKTYPLQQLNEAFSDMHAGNNAKGVIVF